MKLTLGEIKARGLPTRLGVCADDPALIEWINDATQRMLSRGRWVGTTQRYRICTKSGCLTWPRQIETIEAFAVCNRPSPIRNQWFEFYPNGPGLLSDDSCSGDQLMDRGGGFVSFADILNTKLIRLYCDYAGDVGKQVLLQGRDENNQWILTNDGATNGEIVTLAMPFAVTTKTFSALTGVQKVETLGPVRAYTYDPDTTDLLALAYWEPDEKLPDYRRSLVPGLSNRSKCCGTTGDCEDKAVTVVAKLKFIPVRFGHDDDENLIGNYPALHDMAISVQALQNHRFDEAKAFEASALAELQAELDSFMGDGEEVTIKYADRCTAGPYVENLIG